MHDYAPTVTIKGDVKQVTVYERDLRSQLELLPSIDRIVVLEHTSSNHRTMGAYKQIEFKS